LKPASPWKLAPWKFVSTKLATLKAASPWKLASEKHAPFMNPALEKSAFP
jgi:hypothetical protein